MSGDPDPRPRRTKRVRLTQAERDAALVFKRTVLALDGGCLVHPGGEGCDGELHAHHVVGQQELRKRGLSDFAWKPGAGMVVCERAHRRHHNGWEPIPRALVPARCIAFVYGLGLEDVLDRHYPSA